MDQVDALQRRLRQPGEQFGGVAGKQPHIGPRLLIELREDLRHAR